MLLAQILAIHILFAKIETWNNQLFFCNTNDTNLFFDSIQYLQFLKTKNKTREYIFVSYFLISNDVW